MTDCDPPASAPGTQSGAHGGQHGSSHGSAHKGRIIRVVAALIRDRDRDQVLLTQRKPGSHLGMAWEFPGGKVEAGESDEEALKRELREEIDVDARVGTLCFETRHTYGKREMHLMVFRCTILSGTPHAVDVNAMEWVDRSALDKREFLPADLPLVQGLLNGLVAYDADAKEADEDDSEVVVAQVIRPPASCSDE